MQQVIKQHLLRAQLRMKLQADKNRSEISLEMGDQVFMKLQPYVQSSLARRAHQKLAFKFFGPFAIMEKIGSIAYKLPLPENWSIHPVFHVSQLRKVVSNSQLVSKLLPDDSISYQVPELILKNRMVHRGDADIAKCWSSGII
jgi:hypothetical protein